MSRAFKILWMSTAAALGMEIAAADAKASADDALAPTAIHIEAEPGILAARPVPGGRYAASLSFPDKGALAAFFDDGETLTTLWRRELPPDAILPLASTVADATGDGFPEVALRTEHAVEPYTCTRRDGTQTEPLTSANRVSLLDGRTGETLLTFAPGWPKADCALNADGTSRQSTLASLIVGAGGHVFGTRTYETLGWFYSVHPRREGEPLGPDVLGNMFYPSTDSYGPHVYPAAAKAYHGNYAVNSSHLANGLIWYPTPDDPRLIMFTSARVLQLRVGPRGEDQLVFDTPFLSAGPASQAFDGGRNYGLIKRISAGGRDLILHIAGTGAIHAVQQDLVSRALDPDFSIWDGEGYDARGGIARHIDIYDPASGTITDTHYYSYRHDPEGSGLHNYGGRVVYPFQPVMEVDGRTFLFVNVYNEVDGRDDNTVDDRWHVAVYEVSGAGEMRFIKRLQETYLWDIVATKDGEPRLLTSRMKGYFPRGEADDWATQVNVWDGEYLSEVGRLEGLPRIGAAGQDADTGDSSGSRFKALITDEGMTRFDFDAEVLAARRRGKA